MELKKFLHETLHSVDITHLPEGISLIILAVISIGAGFTGLLLAYLIYIVDILSYFKVKVPLKKRIEIIIGKYSLSK